MKRFIIAALALALMLVPATAMAKHGRKLHRSRGQVGTITSYDSSTGELVVTTRKGREISGLVTDDTRIRCSHDDHVATASRHGDDDHSGPGHGGDDRGDDDRGGDDDGANHDAGDDHGDHHEPGDDHGDDEDHRVSCDEDDLTQGAVVRRARIELSEDDAVWTKLKLA